MNAANVEHFQVAPLVVVLCEIRKIVEIAQNFILQQNGNKIISEEFFNVSQLKK